MPLDVELKELAHGPNMGGGQVCSLDFSDPEQTVDLGGDHLGVGRRETSGGARVELWEASEPAQDVEWSGTGGVKGAVDRSQEDSGRRNSPLHLLLMRSRKNVLVGLVFGPCPQPCPVGPTVGHALRTVPEARR